MSAVPSECTEANRPFLSSLLLSRLSHTPVLTPIVSFPSCPFLWQRGGSCPGRLSHPPLQGPPVAPSQRRNSGPCDLQASHTRGHPLGDPGSSHSTCSGAPPCPWASLIHPSGLFSSATSRGLPLPIFRSAASLLFLFPPHCPPPTALIIQCALSPTTLYDLFSSLLCLLLHPGSLEQCLGSKHSEAWSQLH